MARVYMCWFEAPYVDNALEATRDETAKNLVSGQGAVKPFLIVPHSSENDAWFVTFIDQDLPYVRSRRNYNTGTLEFAELSRGLFP